VVGHRVPLSVLLVKAITVLFLVFGCALCGWSCIALVGIVFGGGGGALAGLAFILIPIVLLPFVVGVFYVRIPVAFLMRPQKSRESLMCLCIACGVLSVFLKLDLLGVASDFFQRDHYVGRSGFGTDKYVRFLIMWWSVIGIHAFLLLLLCMPSVKRWCMEKGREAKNAKAPTS